MCHLRCAEVLAGGVGWPAGGRIAKPSAALLELPAPRCAKLLRDADWPAPRAEHCIGAACSVQPRHPGSRLVAAACGLDAERRGRSTLRRETAREHAGHARERRAEKRRAEEAGRRKQAAGGGSYVCFAWPLVAVDEALARGERFAFPHSSVCVSPHSKGAGGRTPRLNSSGRGDSGVRSRPQRAPPPPHDQAVHPRVISRVMSRGEAAVRIAHSSLVPSPGVLRC